MPGNADTWEGSWEAIKTALMETILVMPLVDELIAGGGLKDIGCSYSNWIACVTNHSSLPLFLVLLLLSCWF